MPRDVENAAENAGPWTMLTYIAGDNDLSDAGLRDVEEMTRVGASPEVNIGVEMDCGEGGPVGSIRYQITEPHHVTARGHRTVMERLPEQNSGDPAVLTNFLKWGVKTLPARNYLIVVWGHGTGFRPPRRNVGLDWSSGKALDIPSVVGALHAAGIGELVEGVKARIVGFDACLMGMLEIGYQFKDVADIMVGSQHNEPGDGWPYHRVIQWIKEITAIEGLDLAEQTREIARGIVDCYIDENKSKGQSDVTQAAMDLSRIDALAARVDVLGRALTSHVDRHWELYKKIHDRTQLFNEPDYMDLVGFAIGLQQANLPVEIRDAARAVEVAARAPQEGCILSSGSLPADMHAHGVSIWFPTLPHEFQHGIVEYRRLAITKDHPGWVDFLQSYQYSF